MTNTEATNTMTNRARVSQEETRTTMKAGQENMMADSEEIKYMMSVASDKLYDGRDRDKASRKGGQPVHILFGRNENSFDLDEHALAEVLLQ